MKYILIATLVLYLTGCNKRKTCSVPRSKIGSVVAFKGFNVQELDTIVLRRYPANGLFAQPDKSDTLVTPPILLKTDTALTANGSGFFYINEGADYEVILPVAGRNFHITGVKYIHETPYIYESDDKGFCWEQGEFFSSPDSLAVEQVPTAPGYYNSGATFVFLPK